MAGSSIATPSAATWVTDLLYHAYYGLPRADRSLDNLRLAFGILNTRWLVTGRRVGLRDRGTFHAAFGARRLGMFDTLDRDALLSGAERLIGGWFEGAWGDPARRAHGIAFRTQADRRAFDAARRQRHAALRQLTPPRSAPERQRWATYPPVPLPDPDAALKLLLDPGRWPDFSSAAGRFTALRPGGLKAQTFEILLTLTPTPHTVVFTRGYVTCTDVRLRGGPLAEAVHAAQSHTDAVPAGAEALAYIELTTHAGHFMGNGISRLIIYAHDGGAFVCDVGSWDPLPPHLALPYAAGGHSAQVAFWGPGDPEAGMLAQLAVVSAANAGLG